MVATETGVQESVAAFKEANLYGKQGLNLDKHIYLFVTWSCNPLITETAAFLTASSEAQLISFRNH